MRFLISFFFMCACFVVLSQHENKQQHNIDILNYNLTLTIQDKNNSIDGVEHILIRYKKEIDSFYNNTGKVNPKDYFNSIKNLKSRFYSER